MELGIILNPQPGAKPGPFMACEYNSVTPKILQHLSRGECNTAYLSLLIHRPRRQTYSQLLRLQRQGRVRRVKPGMPGRYGYTSLWALA